MRYYSKLLSYLFSVSLCWAESIPLYIGTGNTEGIYKAELNVKTGELSEAKLVAELNRPSALAVSADKQTLFSVGRVIDESSAFKKEALYAFKIVADGALREINHQTFKAAGACYVFAHPNGKNCFIANYTGGSVSSFKVDEVGALSESVSTIQHIGSSVHEKRQMKPHAHSVYSSPDGVHVYAADLGTDEVIHYQLHQSSASLKRLGEAKVPPGSGPRHMAFNKDGSKLYVLNEFTLTVSVFEREVTNGFLTLLSTHPVTTTFDERFSCSEIRFSDDFKHLYVGKRDQGGKDRDLICVLDAESLNIIQEYPAGVWIPRHFNLSPSGKWLVVAGQKSNQLIVHKRDPETGRLSKTEFTSSVAAPMWILFL